MKVIRGVAKTDLLARSLKKNLENFARIASKIRDTFKGKNLLPEGEDYFLKSSSYGKEQSILCHSYSGIWEKEIQCAIWFQ